MKIALQFKRSEMKCKTCREVGASYGLADGKPEYCASCRPDDKYVILNKNPIALRYVIVEIDEDQHRHYDYHCERAREHAIQHTLAAPVIFVRYNPDPCRDHEGRIRRISEQFRLKQLLHAIRTALYETIPENVLEPIYLFYDEPESARTTQNVNIK